MDFICSFSSVRIFLSQIRSKIKSILVGRLFPIAFKNNQNSSFCNLYSILSHSVAISCCLNLIAFPSLVKLLRFKKRALISSAFVSEILPIFKRVKTFMGSSSTDSYQIKRTLLALSSFKSLIFGIYFNSVLQKSLFICLLSPNHSFIKRYALVK